MLGDLHAEIARQVFRRGGFQRSRLGHAALSLSIRYSVGANRGSVLRLCIIAAVAPTTALRRIARRTETGIVEHRPDLLDRGRAFKLLPDRANEAMRRYIVAIRGSRLAGSATTIPFSLPRAPGFGIGHPPERGD